jgi:hypothetical protein
MKYLDNLLVVCAFGLSTTTLAMLFATFSAWAYGELGPEQRDVIAVATQPLGAVAAGARAASPGQRGVASEATEVQFEPITVIGHRRDAEAPQIAQSEPTVMN